MQCKTVNLCKRIWKHHYTISCSICYLYWKYKFLDAQPNVCSFDKQAACAFGEMVIREVVTVYKWTDSTVVIAPSVRWHTGRKQSYQIVEKDGTHHGASLQSLCIYGSFFCLLFLHFPACSENPRPSEKTWTYCCMCNNYACQ